MSLMSDLRLSLKRRKRRWDSSDPERAPPPLPLNPRSMSPAIQRVARYPGRCGQVRRQVERKCSQHLHSKPNAQQSFLSGAVTCQRISQAHAVATAFRYQDRCSVGIPQLPREPVSRTTSPCYYCRPNLQVARCHQDVRSVQTEDCGSRAS